MTQEPLTLYKLIVLYMLELVNFPLTKAQISDFILEKEYTNFLTLQQAISELTESGMVIATTIGNRTQLQITEEGANTLSYFQNRISNGIKEDIRNYLKENSVMLHNEVSITSEYYRTPDGEYAAHLSAKEKNTDLVDITLSVPFEEMASHICDNWQKKNQEIYKYLTKQLF
ncbi:MAG: DUF4364 family protein [Roseburia sp.]|nr:DUF4364 family protein [Roseburia sp.]MCM1279860.1 DUF4364 family protein [Robinsoniella sp.]